jgi:hypothetical protein
MRKLVALLIPIAFMTVMHANAQTTPRVDQRQQNQHDRIRHGIASDELTRREAAHAVQDQRHIRRSERRAKADGHVTRRERARLHHQQNQASRELRRNKHDAQTRAGAF